MQMVSCFPEVSYFYVKRYFLISIADNGTLTFWDYATGIPFQHLNDLPQPGSLEAEAGVFCSTFDITGTRLITGGVDKTIKVRISCYIQYADPDKRPHRYTLNLIDRP